MAASVEAASSYHDLAVMIDGLRAESSETRIASATQLAFISEGLGPERTREELLPFLSDSIDDDDLVLLKLSASLSQLTPALLGGSEHMHMLLQPLELLLTVEESSVRTSAIESLILILPQLPKASVGAYLVPMVQRLGTREWFTSRISSSLILPLLIPLLDVSEVEPLLALFNSLCNDDTPMVRRHASKSIPPLLENLIKHHYSKNILESSSPLHTTILPLFTTLSCDDQDSVRLQTTMNCISLTEVLVSTQDSSPSLDAVVQERILPLLKSCIVDRSWRVRWTVGNNFGKLGAYDLSAEYVALATDSESEVRIAALTQLGEVANVKNRDLIVELCEKICEDVNDGVRGELAGGITGLGEVFGKEVTTEKMLPIMLKLLRDEDSEVRLRLINGLGKLSNVIGVSLLSQSLLPSIMDLAADKTWRVRLAIIEEIPRLAEDLGVGFFDEKFCGLCLTWLSDDCSSIRVAAAENLKQLTKLFGKEWMLERVMPKIQELRANASYLRRLTCLVSVGKISESIEEDVIKAEMLPVVIDMAGDSVPNIRFNVAKALEQIGKLCNKACFTITILPVLNTLEDDTDRDVMYFAKSSKENLIAFFA